MPLHGLLHKKRLTFAHHKGTELTLFTEEIRKGIEIGNTYEFIDG